MQLFRAFFYGSCVVCHQRLLCAKSGRSLILILDTLYLNRVKETEGTGITLIWGN